MKCFGDHTKNGGSLVNIRSVTYYSQVIGM